MTIQNKSTEHGDITIERDGDIFIFKPLGAFNIDAVKAYESYFVKMLSDSNLEKWALLNDYSEFGICGPEVTKMVRLQLQWCSQSGCGHTAFIINSALQEYCVTEALKGLTFQYIEIFKDFDEAKKSLLEAFEAS